MVLAIALSSCSLGEAIVDLIAGSGTGPFEHAIQDTPTLFVFVETERLEVM